MMSASQWISCVCLLMCFLNCISEDIKAKPGGDVLLQCHGPTDAEIKLVKCIRPDLKSEGFVFYFRDKHPYKDKQHPFFFDRVELRDPEMKDGDVSVILKNVTVNDTGTYECYVGFGASSEFISSITLTVRDSGGAAGHTEEEGKKNKETKNGGHNNVRNKYEEYRIIVGVLALAVAVAVGFVILTKVKGLTELNLDGPPAKTAGL